MKMNGSISVGRVEFDSSKKSSVTKFYEKNISTLESQRNKRHGVYTGLIGEAQQRSDAFRKRGQEKTPPRITGEPDKKKKKKKDPLGVPDLGQAPQITSSIASVIGGASISEQLGGASITLAKEQLAVAKDMAGTLNDIKDNTEDSGATFA